MYIGIGPESKNEFSKKMHFHMHAIVSIPEQRKSRMLQCRSSGKPRTSILRRLSW